VEGTFAAGGTCAAAAATGEDVDKLQHAAAGGGAHVAVR
jgi:hypothetical protein